MWCASTSPSDSIPMSFVPTATASISSREPRKPVGFELHHATWERRTASGGRLVTESVDHTSAIASGKVTVACLRTRVSAYYDADAATATITIVDPEGFYVPWNPACGFGEQSRIRITASKDEDPAEMLRRVPGVRPSDEFRVPKYPESPQYWPASHLSSSATGWRSGGSRGPTSPMKGSMSS
jgi:hypothetical protein